MKNRAVEVYKKPVELTFVLRLKEDAAHRPDTVTFHLKANSRAKIKLFWGVSVTYIFELMRCSWKDFEKAMERCDREGEASPEILNESVHAIVDCPFEP